MSYEQHLKEEEQIQRLRVRQNHMDLLLTYLTKMMDKIHVPHSREFYQLQVGELNEVLKQPDKVIQTLEQLYIREFGFKHLRLKPMHKYGSEPLAKVDNTANFIGSYMLIVWKKTFEACLVVINIK